MRDLTEPRRYLVDRLIPGDPNERSGALPAHAPEGIQQPIAMVRALEISVDLCAEKAVGERMVRVAYDPRRSSAFDGDTRRACIGAIVRTAATHDAGIALSESNSAHSRGRSGKQDGDRRRSKRYRAGRRRATTSGAASNTFDFMD